MIFRKDTQLPRRPQDVLKGQCICCFLSLCHCVIVIGNTDLPQRPQDDLKARDSCWSRSSKLHLIHQLCQQLHSVTVYHDKDDGDNDFNDFDDVDFDLGSAQHPFSLPGPSLENKNQGI